LEENLKGFTDLTNRDFLAKFVWKLRMYEQRNKRNKFGESIPAAAESIPPTQIVVRTGFYFVGKKDKLLPTEITSVF